jgi:hypothetical protein
MYEQCCSFSGIINLLENPLKRQGTPHINTKVRKKKVAITTILWYGRRSAG